MSIDVSRITKFLNNDNYFANNIISFKTNTLAVLLSSLIVMTPASAFSAEARSVDEIQADVTRLKELLEQAQQELQGATGTGSSSEVSNEAIIAEETENALSEAQTGSEVQEVLISAERRKTLKAVHDDPVSVSVVGAEDLSRELAQDYNAISKRLSNVTFNQSNTRGASLS